MKLQWKKKKRARERTVGTFVGENRKFSVIGWEGARGKFPKVMVMFYALIAVWVTRVYASVKMQQIHAQDLCISKYVNYISKEETVNKS